jgi:hypothetical protein
MKDPKSMRKLALCLSALLIVATLAEDVEAGRRHRRRARRCYYYQPCVPCVPCVPTCSQPSQPSAQLLTTAGFPQVCPYYSMGSIWYAERFETSCTGTRTPVGHPTGGPMSCPNCDEVDSSPTYRTTPCYLAAPIAHTKPKPPGHNGAHGTLVGNGNPHHATVATIDGKDVPESTTIYIAYYRMRTTQTSIPFTVGYECDAPLETVDQSIDINTEPYGNCPGVFIEKVKGNNPTKPMLILLTKASSDSVGP